MQGQRKFALAKFLDYKMVNNKTVISQVQEMQIILQDIATESRILSESF